MRLTDYASGGGCACKIPPGKLEQLVAPVQGSAPHLLVGVENGDDAAVIHVRGDHATIATIDFFAPVVDDPFDFGRIAAANALSDIYAMGGIPLAALNVVGWPLDTLDEEILSEVLRGGSEVASLARCPIAGGHSIVDPEPKYGLSVVGEAPVSQLIRNDAARAGMPLTLTKPLGLGVLNTRHKRTGERFEQAISIMTTLNADASRPAVEAGSGAGTDVTGFGLLGHLHNWPEQAA